MQISEQQVRFFKTFGYLSFPGAFANEAEAISEEFERVWRSAGAAIRDGSMITSSDRRLCRLSTRANT